MSTGVIQTGLYTIQNVDNKVYTNLADGNVGTPLTSIASEGPNIKWNVTLLSNKYYTIKSFVFATSEAFASAVPSDGDAVVAKSDTTQWTIKETNIKGNYLISPSVDNTLFWNVASAADKTKIKLSKAANDDSKWILTVKQA